MRVRGAAAVCLLLGLGSLALAAQEPRQSPTFTETVDVRVVNVEVVVTDRSGERVPGLSAEDFELRVDGEVVPIEYFTEVRDGAASVAAVNATPTDAPLPVASAEPGDTVPTNYLVFIDEFFALAHDRNRVLDALIEQVAELGPEERVAVVRYDGRELAMVTSWTSDRALLAAELGELKRGRTQGLTRFAELRREQLALNEADLGRGLAAVNGQLTLEERYYVDRLTEQVERVVTAAASTLRSFAAPPGRKAMLLLSGGWPYDPAEFAIDDPRRPITEGSVRRGAELFLPLTDTANQLGYTLYTIDVPGLESSSVDISSSRADSRVNGLTGRSFVRESGLHHSLQWIAGQTGGVALLNAGRDRALAAVRDDLDSYYWLGFVPERRGDDERHEIEVIVSTPGLRVRSRESFLDFSREREVTLQVESALYFGAPPSPEPLGVTLGRPERAGLRTMFVPVSLTIPSGAVTFLPTGQGFVAQLELRVAVLDDKGATTDTPVVPLLLGLEEAPKEGSVLRYDTRIKLRRRPHDVVVAVYDTATGSILSSVLEIRP